MSKRLFDIFLIIISAPITVPVMLIAYILLYFTTGTPVLFRQKRIGKDEKEFILVKFRTMRDGPGDDVERTTKIGALFRKLSIDELPELWNILKGEMSLVGPRPLPSSYLDHYLEHEKKRHQVLPGLTGLAQASGRNALSWKRKFAYDLEYVEKESRWLDIKVIIQTVFKLLKTSEINAGENITMMPLTKRLCILGSGGHAKVVYDLAKSLGHEIKGVYDQDSKKVGRDFFDYKIKDQKKLKGSELMIIAIGSQKIRKDLSQKFNHFATLIHPNASISPSVSIGVGTVVFDGAIIQADSKIGEHCIINTGAQVDHDCDIKSYTHIAPGVKLCGNVTIHESNLISVGSSIIPGISIGKNNLIAAGSTVTHNIETQNKLWAGSPAKQKKDL